MGIYRNDQRGNSDMTVGRITFGSKDGDELKRALDTIRSPGGGVHLVSHGFKTRCRVCERHTHAKWHDVASGDVNPIALIQMVESLNDDGTGVVSCVVDWVCLVAGIDKAAMRAMLESERTPAAVDPVGELAKRDPTTRVSKGTD